MLRSENKIKIKQKISVDRIPTLLRKTFVAQKIFDALTI
jgi:hypothetical protein